MKAISMLGAALVAALMGLGTAAPAAAEGQQSLQPPASKYASQYARKSGMFLNLGNIAYVRVPTIRLRVGSVKFREVQAANYGGGHFVSGVGHFRPGPSRYGRQQRIFVPVVTPYSYLPYGNGGPFHGAPSGYVASYYGQPGFNGAGFGAPNGRLEGRLLRYGNYGFNTGQGLPGQQREPAYRSSFNAPSAVYGPPRKQRPAAQPRFVHFNGATVKSGALPTVHKPAGKNLIRVE